MLTVAEFYEAMDCLEHVLGSDESMSREVTGGYCGDLLSWVMGRAQAGHAWVTIMNNNNVAAVAQLTDVSCVILAEDVTPSDQLVERARMEDLPLFRSGLSAYELCGKMHRVLCEAGGR